MRTTLLLLAAAVLLVGCATEAAPPPVAGAPPDDPGVLQAVLLENEPEVFGGLWIEHDPEYRVVIQVTGDARRIYRRYVKGTALEGVADVRRVDSTWAELEQAQASTMRTLAEIGSSASTSIDVRENCVTVYASDEEALRTKLTASGASLPDAVCVVAVGPYAQAPALDLPLGVAFPRQDPPEGLLAEMEALLYGRLVSEEGCLRIVADDGTAYLVIWPYDYTVALENGDRVAVLDGSGTTVARVGDLVRMGGGTSPSIASPTVRDAMGDCEGPLWIASHEIQGLSLESLSEDPDIAPLLADLDRAGVVRGDAEESRAALLYPEPGIAYALGEAGWLHLHRYPSVAIAEVRAASIAQDARNAIIDWVAPPGFYRCGRVMALYLGVDDGVKDVLLSRCTLVVEPY